MKAVSEHPAASSGATMFASKVHSVRLILLAWPDMRTATFKLCPSGSLPKMECLCKITIHVTNTMVSDRHARRTKWRRETTPQGKSYRALLYGHRGVVRQERSVSQKSFEVVDAVFKVILPRRVNESRGSTHSKTIATRQQFSAFQRKLLTVKQQNNDRRHDRRENQAKRKVPGGTININTCVRACVYGYG